MPYRSTSSQRTEVSDGEVYDVDTHAMVPYHHIDDSYLITDSIYTSSGPYHGDHQTAYDYGIGAHRVIGDSPFVKWTHYDNPVDHLTSNYNYYSTGFLSKLHTPFSWSPVNGVYVENEISRAITEAINALKGQASQWGSDLGEMKQTVNSFSELIMKGCSFIKNMRAGRWAQAAYDLGISPASFTHSSNRGRTLANYWLAYVYGWRPYAQSVYDIQATIADVVKRVSKTVEGKGHGHVSGSASGSWSERLLFDSSYTAGTRCVLRGEISHPALFNINKFGLSNPVSIAWELVPFSFCVDWFIPVGNTLSALTGAAGLDFHGGWYSVKTKSNVNLTHTVGVETYWVSTVEGGQYSEEQITFNRTALTAFPLPRLYADMTPFSTPRAVNALALVRQLT